MSMVMGKLYVFGPSIARGIRHYGFGHDQGLPKKTRTRIVPIAAGTGKWRWLAWRDVAV